MNLAQLEEDAKKAEKLGGPAAHWPKTCRQLIRRIVQLEKELQQSRQLSLFGDVTPPRKTPIGT